VKLLIVLFVICVIAFAVACGPSNYPQGLVADEVPFSVEFKTSVKLVDLYEVTMRDGTKCLMVHRPDSVAIDCGGS